MNGNLKVISNKFGGSSHKLTNELIDEMTIKNAMGGTYIDLTMFSYPNGELTINLDNKIGKVIIIVNEQTEVVNMVKDTGINTLQKTRFISTDKTSKLKVVGTNKCGNCQIYSR